MIGNFQSNDIKFKLKNIDPTEIQILDEPWDLCVIQNNYLLTANYFQSSITLYDRNFQVIRVLDAIGSLTFKSLSITTNDVDRIYISDFMNNRIIMCSYEFEPISVVGEYGTNYRQFNGPSGICYYDNCVYVCDYYNERIQILTSTLKSVRSFLLYLTPFYIKISNSIAAIKPDNDDFLYFYDLPHFSIRYKYDQHVGSICIFNELFYQFDYINMKFLCYDENGFLNDDIKINEFDELNFDDWTCLTQFEDKLIICPGSSLSFYVV
jgi:hypothetical protein